MNKCGKAITGYKAEIKPTDSLSPYGSKYFGMAFIPKGTQWPVCDNCQREMILILQLQISDLPEEPPGLHIEEGDMLQIFTCAYVDPKTDDSDWNEHTQKPVVQNNHKCFNPSPYREIADEDRLDLKSRVDVEEFNQLQKEYLDFLNYTDDPEDIEYDSVMLQRVTSFLKFHARKINTNGVDPVEFRQLPWVDSYHLIDNNSVGTWRYSDKFSGSATKANENARKELGSMVSGRIQFVCHDISHNAHTIIGWQKFSYKCLKSPLYHRIFNGCCSHGEPDWYERGSYDFAGMDYLGALTIDENSFLNREEMSCYPSCDCCQKPMKLLYSFMPAMKGPSLSRAVLHGLFYCEESGALQTSCIDHRKG